MVADNTGTPIAFNDAYRDLASRLIGTEMRPGLKVNTFSDEANRLRWDRIHQRALSGERFRIENQIAERDGSVSVFEMIYTPIRRNGKVDGFTEISRNITEQKKKDAELRRQEQLLRSVLDQSPLPIAITDPVGALIDVNPAFREELGLDDTITAGAALHDVASHVTLFTEDDKPIGLSGLPIVRALKGEVTRGEALRVRRDDGTERDVVVSAVPVVGSDDELIAACTFLTDVTEMRRNQAQLREAISEREMLIKEVHHRVKNNLSIIIALQNLQLNRVTDERSRRLFLESVTRIHVMASIHEKLYSSQNVGPVSAGPYFRDLLQYIMAAYRLSPETREVTTEFDDLEMDANALVPCGLIVNELTTNTIKYAAGEGKKCAINLSITRSDPEHVELRYSDNGDGIPDSVDLESPGTLGLQLVTSLSRQLGGDPVFTNGTGMGFRLLFRNAGADEPAPMPVSEAGR